MKIGDHLYRADRLLVSAEVLCQFGRLQEAAWIYSVAGTHCFNSVLHWTGLTLDDQGLATHHAGYYCNPDENSTVRYSERGDVIHADMPPIGDIYGLPASLQKDLREIEIVAIPALHKDVAVSLVQLKSIREVILSMRHTIQNLEPSWHRPLEEK